MAERTDKDPGKSTRIVNDTGFLYDCYTVYGSKRRARENAMAPVAHPIRPASKSGRTE
jgi:hypothetical protein